MRLRLYVHIFCLCSLSSYLWCMRLRCPYWCFIHFSLFLHILHMIYSRRSIGVLQVHISLHRAVVLINSFYLLFLRTYMQLSLGVDILQIFGWCISSHWGRFGIFGCFLICFFGALSLLWSKFYCSPWIFYEYPCIMITRTGYHKWHNFLSSPEITILDFVYT